MPSTYVYLLKSKNKDHRYTSLTNNLKTGLNAHNSGKVSSTAKFRPWKIQAVDAFGDQEKATSFEKISNLTPAEHLPKNAPSVLSHK